MNQPTEQILAEDGPDRNRLVIKLGEFKTHPLLELRYWFLDKASQKFKPTRKGINLTRNNYLVFKKVIDSYHELIMDWLRVGYVPEHVEKYSIAQQEAAQQARFRATQITIECVNEPKNKLFFEINHQGGADSVRLNDAHAFIRSVRKQADSSSDDVNLKYLSKLLTAFTKAAIGLKDSAATHPEILFDQLIYDWSEYLREQNSDS